MKSPYDKYYQTKDLFGEPYPELISFFSAHPQRGKLLDLGCGQGRNAIPLARIGYQVTGIDVSQIVVNQMLDKAEVEGLPMEGIVLDIYQFPDISSFDFILLDSMFHFSKKDRRKEMDFIKRIIRNVSDNTLICFCIQSTEKKLNILNEAIGPEEEMKRIHHANFEYVFTDDQTGHSSKTDYQMIVIKK